MGQIINWLRRSEDFAFLVLDFGTPFDDLEQDFPTDLTIDSLKNYINDVTVSAGLEYQHFVLLGGGITVDSLKELIQLRFEKFSENHKPYIWKRVSFYSDEGKKPIVDVLVDVDDDGRAMIFHNLKNTSLDPYGNLELVASFLGDPYSEAYPFLGNK